MFITQKIFYLESECNALSNLFQRFQVKAILYNIYVDWLKEVILLNVNPSNILGIACNLYITVRHIIGHTYTTTSITFFFWSCMAINRCSAGSRARTVECECAHPAAGRRMPSHTTRCPRVRRWPPAVHRRIPGRCCSRTLPVCTRCSCTHRANSRPWSAGTDKCQSGWWADCCTAGSRWLLRPGTAI